MSTRKKLNILTVPNNKEFSKGVISSIIYFSLILQITVLILEIYLDIKFISYGHILPTLLLNIVIYVAFLRGVSPRLLGLCNVVLFYITFEVHFLSNPRIFYFILFWFSFTLLVAFFIGGIKQFYIWLGILIITSLANYQYAVYKFGKEFHEENANVQNILADIFFPFGLVVFIGLLFWLLVRSYLQITRKSIELEKLKNVSEQKRITLENYIKVSFKILLHPIYRLATLKSFTKKSAVLPPKIWA